MILGKKNDEYLVGFALSLAGHLLLGYLVLFQLQENFAAKLPPMAYSVTIEGAKSIGGISQVPKDSAKSPVAPAKKVSAPEQPIQKVEPKTPPKEEPKAPEEKAEVSLAEKPKKEPKPTPTPAKKETKAAEKKAEAKKAEKPKEKPKPKDTLAEVNKSYQQAMQRYLGESSDAGGKNFGGAALGGKGMGGGIQVSPEFLAYYNLLKSRIKSEWRWFDTSAPLVAKVVFSISPEGNISGISISESSGNTEFDNSVVRAISKANPVPPPPEKVYDQFKRVRMSFDPRD